MNQYIEEKHGLFALHTDHTSYLFQVDGYGHLEHIHYGRMVSISDAEALSVKQTLPYGTVIEYEDNVQKSWRNVAPFEYGNNGIGDYRTPSLLVKTSLGTCTDFTYLGYSVEENEEVMLSGLPGAYDADASLVIHLFDKAGLMKLDLVYTIYAASDVITRRAILYNCKEEPLTINRLMSYSIDMMEDNLVMVSFHGSWANERYRRDTVVNSGTLSISSRTGSSSNMTNPGFILRRNDTNEEHGEAWGFNLVYSGSHKSIVSRDEYGCVRVMGGFNDENFQWTLAGGEQFETPEAFMTYSCDGLNALSQHFHLFIENHIVRGAWQFRERPVLVNDWEAYMFTFTEDKLVALARQGKELGAELFVLDDGWFGERNDDHAGLGDYNVNLKKLPNGIRGLSDKIHDMDMLFGLWFEPEAVNPDSDLYRAHPDWIIHEEGRRNLTGRYEYLLDLSRREVQDYIIENVGRVLDEGDVDYVKWDMNRHMTGMDGAFVYRYMLGLYRVLSEIFYKRPHILLESCSSGGNRFDAGMMCYSPQIWTSDDTDAMERLGIQKGTSYLYPLSTMGAHVSAVPNSQTMRTVSLPVRFAVSAFGVLGYELDLTELSDIEKKEIKEQIAWYKMNRRLLQFGTFYRTDCDDGHESFTISDGKQAVTGVYRRMIHAASPLEKMKMMGLEEGEYEIGMRNAIIPLDFHCPEDLAVCLETAEDGSSGIRLLWKPLCAGREALQYGIPLPLVFNSSGMSPYMRYPLDFGAELYTAVKKK